jgi:hypothetical protein
VPFPYVMFARFIMKFSDVWKLPLQCPAVSNSVYACPPVISPCYVSWYCHVVVTLLMDVCFSQNDGGWTHYCVWCGNRSPATAEKARCSKCCGVVCKSCMERNFERSYGADQCAYTNRFCHGHAWRCPACDPDQLTPSGGPEVIEGPPPEYM